MTLHYSFVCPGFVIQIGDRLLSTSTRGRVKPWDAYSNKSLVIFCRNGLIVLSYAGSAFIDQLPTDSFIANLLLDDAPDQGSRSHSGPSTVFGPVAGLDIGRVLDKVTTGVNARFPKQPASQRDAGLDLLVSGWTWKRPKTGRPVHPRTFLREYTFDSAERGMRLVVPNGETTEARYPLMARRRDSRFALCSIGATFDMKVVFQELQEYYRENSPISADAVETILRDGIRSASRKARGAGIGTELISITCQAMDSPYARIRYIRSESLGGRNAYTPWVITGAMAQPPQTFGGGNGSGYSIGTADSQGNDYTLVDFDCTPALDPPSRIHFSMGQPRRRL